MSSLRNRNTNSNMEELESILTELNSIKELLPLKDTNNYDRRVIYAKSELLLIKIENLLNKKQISTTDVNKEQLEKIMDELKTISNDVKLVHIKRKMNILFKIIYKIDELLRFLSVWTFLVVASTVLALPCIFLRQLDYLLVKLQILSPFNQISIVTKRFIASTILKLSGINLIDNLNYQHFGKECDLVCYSHSSTTDAFIITKVIPVRHYSLGKSDLFLIPFFSWCLMAFGGVPIDRSNRDQAIRAITSAAQAAQMGDCVAIAPEGTRSKTGQIIPFKKGPFYLWEQIKTPIIPLVIFGAYDLYPPGGHLMSLPGKVYAQYLEPVRPTESMTRDEISQLIRTKMLEAWKDGPKDVGAELTWLQRIEQQAYQWGFFGSLYAGYQYIPWGALLHKYQLTPFQAGFGFLGASVGITLVFYAYLMYASSWVTSTWYKLFSFGSSSKSK